MLQGLTQIKCKGFDSFCTVSNLQAGKIRHRSHGFLIQYFQRRKFCFFHAFWNQEDAADILVAQDTMVAGKGRVVRIYDVLLQGIRAERGRVVVFILKDTISYGLWQDDLFNVVTCKSKKIHTGNFFSIEGFRQCDYFCISFVTYYSETVIKAIVKLTVCF